jgi:hypothetical protein
MKIFRTAASGLTGIFCAGSAAMTPTSFSIGL